MRGSVRDGCRSIGEAAATGSRTGRVADESCGWDALTLSEFRLNVLQASSGYRGEPIIQGTSRTLMTLLHRLTHGWIVGLASVAAAMCALQPAVAFAGAFAGGSFLEPDGWRARIIVDCLIKDRQCGTFRFEALGCEGELVFLGEGPTSFDFRAELRAGRCLPGCTLRIASDFSRYTEICGSGRHEGVLAPVDLRPGDAAPGGPHTKSLPGTVGATTSLPGQAGSEENSIPSGRTSPGGGGAVPAIVPERSERIGDSFVKGRYVIDPQSRLVSGKVRVEWDNGNSFDGLLKNGQRSGKGKYVWADGQSYDGDWIDDKPEGTGILVFANGDRYEGQIRGGLPNGAGKKTFAASGDRYEGTFVAGEASGQGSYRWKSGDIYAGNWERGKKNGNGRYTWVNGDYWEGQFTDDAQTGNGRLYFKSALEASTADVGKLVMQTDAAAGAEGESAHAAARSNVDRIKLLAIPMVAKEVRECSRSNRGNCAEQVLDKVLSGDQFPHKWQTMSADKESKGPGASYFVDANSELEGGNIFSWLRSSGSGGAARDIGIKYDCRAEKLEIQLIYNCSAAGSCTLDPNIDKYSGRVLPAGEIKAWFRKACERA